MPPDEAGADADQVRFRVRNQGGRAASAVSLSLTLRDGGEIVSERRLVLDYLPGHSETTGGFVLPAGARGFAADLSVEGYLDPSCRSAPGSSVSSLPNMSNTDWVRAATSEPATALLPRCAATISAVSRGPRLGRYSHPPSFPLHGASETGHNAARPIVVLERRQDC